MHIRLAFIMKEDQNLDNRRILKLLLLFWFIISGIMGCQKNIVTYNDLVEPKFISKTNNPERFRVVEFNSKRKPFIASGKNAKPDQPLILEEKVYPSSFYIEKQNVEAVEQRLTQEINKPASIAYVKLLFDDPVEKKQIVRLHIWDDDYDFDYIYSIDGNTVRPLQYGDRTLGDTATSAVKGFTWFLCWFIMGLTIYGLRLIFLKMKTRILKRRELH